MKNLRMIQSVRMRDSLLSHVNSSDGGMKSDSGLRCTRSRACGLHVYMLLLACTFALAEANSSLVERSLSILRYRRALQDHFVAQNFDQGIVHADNVNVTSPIAPPILPSPSNHSFSLTISLSIIVGVILFAAILIFKQSRVQKMKRRAEENNGSSPTPQLSSSVHPNHHPNSTSREIIRSKSSTVSPNKIPNEQINNRNSLDGNDAPIKQDNSSNNSRKLMALQGGWPPFDMDELLRSSAEPIGTGFFGSAYMVRAANQPPVVVKHLRGVSISRKEFENRLWDLGKLKHNNVLPIVAYYFSETEKLLVHEYLNHGNLSSRLHGHHLARQLAPLDWPARARIALDVARAIAYIHGKGRNKGIVHGNIKSSNVLLRPDMTACVTDYGLMQLLKGTPNMKAANAGYRAPELASNEHFTHKSDVYSYGVLLLELLTGKQPLSATRQPLDLPRIVHASIHEEWTAEIFDPKLAKNHAYEEELVHMLKIAMECVSASPAQRPSMSKVVQMVKMVRESDDPSSSNNTELSVEYARSSNYSDKTDQEYV